VNNNKCLQINNRPRPSNKTIMLYRYGLWSFGNNVVQFFNYLLIVLNIIVVVLVCDGMQQVLVRFGLDECRIPSGHRRSGLDIYLSGRTSYQLSLNSRKHTSTDDYTILNINLNDKIIPLLTDERHV